MTMSVVQGRVIRTVLSLHQIQQLLLAHSKRVGLESIGRLIGRQEWLQMVVARPEENVKNFPSPAEDKMISGRSKSTMADGPVTTYRNNVIISTVRGRKPAVVNWNIAGR